MEEFKNNLKTRTWLGTVISNKDPLKKGRIKCNVFEIFEGLEEEDLPWARPMKSLDGKEFSIPAKGKVVAISFPDGDIYHPLYKWSEHYNINLQKKLEELDDADYVNFKAMMFDHITQIYSHPKDGLTLDYMMNQILMKEKSINLNLKDNHSILNLGSLTASQQAMLGNAFLEWMDELVQNLMSPYLGNLQVPVIANPSMISVLAKYQALRKTFLSDHVNIVDNNQVDQIQRIAEGVESDSWTSEIENNVPVIVQVPFTSQPGISSASIGEDANGFVPPKSVPLPSPIPKPVDEGRPTVQPFPADTPNDNPGIKQLFDTMKGLGYKIFDRPYELNIIGVRRFNDGDVNDNLFGDRIHVIYKDENGKWIHKWHWATTVPGTGTLPKHRAMTNPETAQGIGILVPGQYLNTWKINEGRSHPADVHIIQQVGGPVVVFRDPTKDTTLNYGLDASGKKTGKTYSGFFGINIHRSSPQQSQFVNNWSHGCQVFKQGEAFGSFLELCKKMTSKYGNKISYTLLTKKQVEEISKKPYPAQ